MTMPVVSMLTTVTKTLDSVVDIETGYELKDLQFEARYGEEFSPYPPDRLWGPPF
jgi:hypothetical protein